MEAVAKYDFKATASDELSFLKGSILKVNKNKIIPIRQQKQNLHSSWQKITNVHLTFLNVFYLRFPMLVFNLIIYLNIFPIYLPVYLLSIYPFIRESIYLHISLFRYQSVCLSVCPPIHPSPSLHISLFRYLSTRRPLYLPIYPSMYVYIALDLPIIYLRIHLLLYPSVYQFVYILLSGRLLNNTPLLLPHISTPLFLLTTPPSTGI